MEEIKNAKDLGRLKDKYIFLSFSGLTAQLKNKETKEIVYVNYDSSIQDEINYEVNDRVSDKLMLKFLKDIPRKNMSTETKTKLIACIEEMKKRIVNE